MKTFKILLFTILGILFWQCSDDDDAPIIPENVSNLTAEVADGQVTLNWNTGDASVKNYSITFEPSGAVMTRENPPVVIDQLINGLEYTFNVKARSATDHLSEGTTITAVPMGKNSGEGVPFVGDVLLETQADVDDWNENFTYVVGDFTVQGDDITNLQPLQNLDSIVGKLKIQFTGVSNLDGLEGIKKVTNSLVIWGNASLTDNNALSNITELGNDLTLMNNDILENIDGLSGVQSIATDIYIGLKGWQNPPGAGPNPALIDFCGLEPVASNNGIGGAVFIGNNAYNPTGDDLANGNCQGDPSVPLNVVNFSAIPGDMVVSLSWELPADASINNFELTFSPDGAAPISIANNETNYEVTGLTNNTEYTFTLVSVSDTGTSSGATATATPGGTVFDGDVQLGSQAEIDAFPSNYTTVTGKLQIFGGDVVDLSPLSNITTVEGKLEILQTAILQSFDGLQVETTGSNVYIADNASLSDMTALSSLTSIGKDLAVLGNPLITSLDGFENVTYIDRHIYIGAEGWQNPPGDNGNILLSDFCALKTVLESGGFDGDYFVDFNAYNPTMQEIIDNCN